MLRPQENQATFVAGTPNHPNTEYTGINIFHFSFFLTTLRYLKQLLSKFEPQFREKFKQLLGLKPASSSFNKKKCKLQNREKLYTGF